MNAPIRSMLGPIATVRSMDDAVDAFRELQQQLGLSNADCDELGNLGSGHTDKLLGPTRAKKMGAHTFGVFCWMFAVKFEMVIDMDQVKVMEQYWEDRQRERPLFPHGKVGRISKKIMAAAAPIVLKERAKLGGMVRAHMLSSKQRSEIARKAAKSRWKKAKRAVVR